jgi:hypothetical protein
MLNLLLFFTLQQPMLYFLCKKYRKHLEGVAALLGVYVHASYLLASLEARRMESCKGFPLW